MDETPQHPTDHSSGPTTVIVGGGLAGATVAKTLREEGYRGRVTLIGAEAHLPYERPPLSKGLLLGTAERDSVLVEPAAWYREHHVELLTGTRVTAIDRTAREVVLDDGERLGWTTLVLATGSTPRRLDVPGADLDGVLYLRTLDDADALVAALDRRPRVVVVGGGWIGLETAAAAREAGLDVTVLEVGALPLLRVLGTEMAQLFTDLHLDHGVTVRTQVQVTELLTADGTAVSGVRLSDGSVLPAELVIVGVGIQPEVRLARDAGLDVADGVVVDEHLRSSDPDVLAVGDVAAAWHPTLGRRLRVEHWANAGRQGTVAARSILGVDAVDDRLPYFYTDQYDVGMEYVGYADPSSATTSVVVRGSIAERELIAFWVDEGRVLAGMNVNVWDVSEQIEALVRSGRTVDAERLADPDVPLTEV